MHVCMFDTLECQGGWRTKALVVVAADSRQTVCERIGMHRRRGEGWVGGGGRATH